MSSSECFHLRFVRLANRDQVRTLRITARSNGAHPGSDDQGRVVQALPGRWKAGRQRSGKQRVQTTAVSQDAQRHRTRHGDT